MRLVRVFLAAMVCPAFIGSVIATRSPYERQVPVVVELFTSEGCSSCPPADELLIDLTRQPPAGSVVLALSEHVDYWDRLGWKDPFSSRVFTERQAAYDAGSSDVYTPQIVVDGQERVVGSDRAAVRSAITRAAAIEKAAVRLTWIAGTSPVLQVTVESDARSADSDVVLAIVEDGLTSSVKRGENAGRVLRHTSVVRRLSRIGRTNRLGGVQITVPIALETSWKRETAHVIVLVQRRPLGRVTAAGVIDVPQPAEKM